LLIFATGNSQVPVTGFKDLQGNDGIMHFKIKRHGNLNDLPKSHTWYVKYYYNFLYYIILFFIILRIYIITYNCVYLFIIFYSN